VTTEGFPVTPIWGDANGTNHFTDERIDLTNGGSIGVSWDQMRCEGAIFRATGASHDYDFHATVHLHDDW